MAKIAGQTTSGFLVEMTPAETKKVFAEQSPQVGTEKNIHEIYNQLVWLVNNKAKLRAFSDALRNSADNLEAAVNTAGV